jgi:hypothetical protein
VIDVQTPLLHHLFEITVAERIPKVPAHAEQNDVGFEMTPFERVLIVHEGNSSVFLNRSRAYHITSFLQQNQLASVVSNVMGKSGRRMLVAMIEGVSDAEALAD